MINDTRIMCAYPKRFGLSLNHAGANLSNSNWAVEPASNYREANGFGREMAAHFLQQLKNDPDLVGCGILGHIAGDIDFQDKTETKGYWVGFFSYLEQYLFRAASQRDVFVDLALVQADFDVRRNRANQLAHSEA